MPSVAQESPTVQSAKKRRRDDNNTHQIPLSHSATNTPRGIFADKTFHHGDLFHHPSPSATRKIIPLPPGKRQRTTVDIDVIDADGEPMQRSPPNSPQRQRHLPQQQQQHHPEQRNLQQIKASAAPREDHHLDDRTTTPSLMSRCHICSRRPNKKADLDSFANCQGCGQRTCYVCIRECLGWGGGGGGPNPNPNPIIHTRAQTHAHNHHHNHAGTPSETRVGDSILPPSALIHSVKETETTTTTRPSSVEDDEAGETSFTMLDADDEEQQPQCYDTGRTDQEQEQQEQGWTRGGGHRRVVCSRCCVERGRDGEVACLGCLPFVEG